MFRDYLKDGLYCRGAQAWGIGGNGRRGGLKYR